MNSAGIVWRVWSSSLKSLGFCILIFLVNAMQTRDNLEIKPIFVSAKCICLECRWEIWMQTRFHIKWITDIPTVHMSWRYMLHVGWNISFNAPFMGSTTYNSFLLNTLVLKIHVTCWMKHICQCYSPRKYNMQFAVKLFWESLPKALLKGSVSLRALATILS